MDMLRALSDLWVQTWQALLAGALALAVVDGWVPSHHLPRTPLDLDQPVGAATPAKISRLEPDGDTAPDAARVLMGECLDALARSGVEAEPVEDADDRGFCRVEGAVRITGGAVAPLSSGVVMRCPLALRYVLWERNVLQPAAREVLGAPVARVEAGGYACRRVYGSASAADRPSEHARANALDIPAVLLTDGRRVAVADGWGPVDPASRAGRQAAETAPEGGAFTPSQTPEARFLRRIRDGACEIFGTVLGPEYNAAHADHLHLDGSPVPLCS